MKNKYPTPQDSARKPRFSKRYQLALPGIIAVLSVLATPVFGQGTGGAGGGHTWLGTADTNFFNTANWNTGFWPNGIAVYGPAGGANTTVVRSSQTYTYQYGISFSNTTDANGSYDISGTQAFAFYDYGVRTSTMSAGTLNEVIHNDIIRNSPYGYETGAGHDLTLNGVISSGTDLIKKGDGTLYLNGANTYTGATFVNDGTLKVTNSSNTPSYTIASGATLDISATPLANTTFLGTGTLEVTGNVSLSATSGTFSMGSDAYIDVKSGGGQIVSNGGNDPWTGSLADVNVDGWLYVANNDLNADVLTGSGLLQMGTNTINLGVDNGTGGVFDGNIRRSYANAHLDKQGTGTQTLNGELNLGSTGTVTVSEGTLVFNGTSSGSNATGSWIVDNGATLSGSGTLSGTATIGDGATLSPGNSPGTQTFENLAWSNGGTYLWEINADSLNGGSGTQGADPGWDWINVTSDWDISGITTNFNIDITSLTNPGNVAGLADGFDYTGLSYLDAYESFTILSFGTLDDTFDASLFTLNDSGFSNPKVGWSLEISGNDLVLNAVFVPEPSSTALLGLGLSALMLRRRRS